MSWYLARVEYVSVSVSVKILVEFAIEFINQRIMLGKGLEAVCYRLVHGF